MVDKHASYNETILGAWLHAAGPFLRAGFLDSVKDCFPQDIRQEEVIRLVSHGCNPSEDDEGIIGQAGHLSRGAAAGETAGEQGEKTGTPVKPLVHLLSTVSMDGRKSSPAYCRLLPLAGDEILPSLEKALDPGKYRDLIEKFEKDFHALKDKPYGEFMSALDTLFEHYFWCIPFDQKNETDVSLYQYARIFTALAGALYRCHEAAQTETVAAPAGENKQRFLFINGDISGIQKYIFDLNDAKQNAKLLRARSFQLWALSEIIAEYLARQFGGGRESIITSAGGKFLLLVAHTPENAGKIPRLRLELEQYFINEFAGKLSFILSEGVPAGDGDFEGGKVQDLLNRIGTCAEEAKQRKMQAYLDAVGPVLEAHYESLQENGECACCAFLPGILPYGDSGGDKKLCRNCSDLIRIGGKLLHTNKIILKTEQLLPFGEMAEIRQKNEPSFGYTINEYNPGSPVMFLPYIAPWADEKRGILKTFEDIAEASTGNKKIAMFKADIDNLGLVFSSSLGSRVSLARYAELSRYLHYFFSAYYSHFIRSHEAYRQNIYTVFSGGDDLCVVGPWDTVMHFAVDFRKELARFTNNNPSLTLSGGISLTSPTLPVRDIAENAEEALEESKQHRDPGNIRLVKNSITVFDTTVSWEDYEKALNDGKKLYDYIQEHKTDGKKGLSSGVVYRLLDFADRAVKVQKGDLRNFQDARNRLWISNFRYMIARNIADTTVRDWFSGFGTTENIIKSRIAVSYGLYANRKESESP
ncbi:type III-A CRISPR-associated protein Cas10/Csm1 [Treponema sp. TIM-1]|uniref:type III-A CRISPR-associated protein Cas10/Csm1 n=1 Tax=Treponema sp. TIM-1 TaxID=2898417 RepID=UPI00397EEC83